MDKDKKKRGGRAYLNDFERDLTGRYHYRGKMYHYRGTLPRQRVLGLLWAGAAVAQVLLLAAGCLDGQGLGRCFYVLLPYVAAFVANVSVCWALGRLTAGGDPLREYVYQASVAKLPMRSMFTAVFSAAAALMCLVHILLNGASWQRVVFILLAVTAAGVQVALRRFLGAFSWECGDEGQMSANEKR